MALNNERGMSAVTSLIMAGVCVLLSTGLIWVMDSQFREVRRLEWKVAVQDIEADARRTLADSASCLRSFAPPFAIDAARVGQSTYSVRINEVIEARSAPRNVISVNSPISGLGGDLRVSLIRASEFTLVSPNLYKFDLNVVISSASLGTISNVKLGSVTMATDSSTPKRAVACNLELGFSTSSTTTCRTVNAIASDRDPIRIACNADEFILAGGGRCYTATGALVDPVTHTADEVGHLINSKPYQTGSITGWEADCHNSSGPDTVRAGGFAYCCRR